MVATMREQAATSHHMMKQMEKRSNENMEGRRGAEVLLEYLKFAEF